MFRDPSSSYVALFSPVPSNNDQSNIDDLLTRSQAVARIADRTASQHFWGLRDVIGQVTIS